MQIRQQVNRFKKLLFPLIILSVLYSGFIGYHRYQLKKELQLDGLFMNLRGQGQGVQIDTEPAGPLSLKLYKKLVIKIPSLASEGDDANKKNADVNKIIDREKFGKGYTDWLRATFDSEFASKYTDTIIIYYRDDIIIEESY